MSWRLDANLASTGGEAALVLNMCVRCGREVLLETDIASEHGVFFSCELAGCGCEEVEGTAQQLYLQCCVACGESRVLAMDFMDLGFDFRCPLAGFLCMDAGASVQECGSFVEDRVAEVQGIGGGRKEPVMQQRCAICGARFETQLDLASLGIDFHCGLVERSCWEAAEELRRARCEEDTEAEERQGAAEKATVLSLVEQQKLDRYRLQLGRDRVKESLRLQGKDTQERFRDSAVVCHRGERFITVGNKAPPGPGCELGGVIGSSSRGRLGLGLRKMTKEEAEKFALSNKERGHLKKKVAHAKAQREIVHFETKQTMHQLRHAAVLAASVVRQG